MAINGMTSGVQRFNTVGNAGTAGKVAATPARSSNAGTASSLNLSGDNTQVIIQMLQSIMSVLTSLLGGSANAANPPAQQAQPAPQTAANTPTPAPAPAAANNNTNAAQSPNADLSNALSGLANALQGLTGQSANTGNAANTTVNAAPTTGNVANNNANAGNYAPAPAPAYSAPAPAPAYSAPAPAPAYSAPAPAPAYGNNSTPQANAFAQNGPNGPLAVAQANGPGATAIAIANGNNNQPYNNAYAPGNDKPYDKQVDYGKKAQYEGDPHLTGFGGEKYDVMGQAGKTYNMISDQGLQYNATFDDYDKGKDGQTVVGKAGLQVGKDQVEFDKSGKATLNGQPLKKGDAKQLDGGSLTYDGNKLSVKTTDYDIDLEAKKDPKGDHINSSQTAHKQSSTRPGGLIGQTADGVEGQKNTGHDLGKQGGTVIDGTVDDYVVDGLFGGPSKR